MTFQNHAMNTAYQMGAYKAIAQMMGDAIRDLDAAADEHDRNWAMSRLMMLAEQLEEAEAKFEKEVDTV